MPASVIDRVARANKTRAPEHSVFLRALVLSTVCTGVLALAVENAVSASATVFVLAALATGYYLSYRRRERDNWHLKIGIAIAATFALVGFFEQLGAVATLDEVRFPLADLFLWVQVLHGFDLPARKDLYFSLASSVALMAIAASLSQDFSFGVLLVGYVLLVIATLTYAHVLEMADGVRLAIVGRRRPWKSARDVLAVVGAVLVTAAIVFLVVPQPTSARSFALPFRLGSGFGSPTGGALVNPGFAGAPGERSSGAAYHGFSEFMDLNVRGDLSDALVMRVRASAPAMWKGMVFDRYDGRLWRGDDSEPQMIVGTPPYQYPAELRSLGPRERVTQTFYVETEQPNAVFAAGQPDSVWIDGGLGVDRLGSLRTPATLTPGSVYSVVSTRGAATPRQLRALGDVETGADVDAVANYLQVPASVPERVVDLARRITAGLTSEYDKVLAIEDHLRDHYRYTLDSPVPPPGRDAVDHFLFDARVGFCEQFASAMTIMLRAIGIPARVATGYAVGARNAFTGYYDVKASDAHAWVEVWFPDGYGWYEFDPTFNVPPATVDVGETIPLVRALRAVAERLAALAPASGRNLMRTITVAVVIGVLAWALWVVARRRRGARRAGTAPAPQTPRAPVAAAWHRWERSLERAGRGRAPKETARELVRRAAPDSRAVVDAFERERYSARPPGPPEIEDAVAELDDLARRAAAAGRDRGGGVG